MGGRSALAFQDKNYDFITFKQLSYFLALAEHGSISAAASAMNMAQPSLSENIAKLEKALDVQLAIRGSRGIQMTEAGMTLVRRGHDLLKGLDDLVEEIRTLSGEPRGPVSVGLPPSLSILLSVPLLETIHSEYPGIRLHIAEAMSGDIVEWINTERIDFGCAYEAYDSLPYTFDPLLTEELFLVTAPDNWPGVIEPNGIARDPIKAKDLEGMPLVLTSPTHGARKLQEKFARSIGVELNVVAAIDALPHIVEMVSRASAYTILSHGAVASQVANGSLALVRIVEPSLTRTAYVVRKRSRPITAASAIVEARIFSIVKEMVERYKITATFHGPADTEPAGASG